MSNLLTILAGIGTAVGALLLAWQIWQMFCQFKTSFEDSIAREYREMMRKIPLKALFGEKLSEPEQKEHLADFYFYFDFCNEQVFYHKIGRISEETWRFWHDGMQANLNRPAFRIAWQEVCSRAGNDFDELRKLFPSDAQQGL
jgi:hypothetical protein